MRRWHGRWALSILLILLAACAPTAPPPTNTSSAGAAAPTKPAAATAAPPTATAPQPAAAPAGAAPVELKIGTTLTLGESVLLLAVDKGYFEADGLSVEVVPFDTGAAMVAPLASGQLDAGVGATSAGLFNAMARDVGMVIVSGNVVLTPGRSGTYLVARKDLVDSGQVRDYADLRGRTLGTTGEGNITTITVAKALERGGLSRDDANVVSMGFPDMLSAYANRSLDASVLAEPFVTNAVERDLAVRWKPMGDVIPNHMVTVWMYSQKLIQERPEAGRRLMVALTRAARDYMDAVDKGRDWTGWVATHVKHTRIKDAALYDRMEIAAVATSGEILMDSLNHDVAWYQANGYLTATPDLSRIVDSRFATYARERLGPYQ